MEQMIRIQESQKKHHNPQKDITCFEELYVLCGGISPNFFILFLLSCLLGGTWTILMQPQMEKGKVTMISRIETTVRKPRRRISVKIKLNSPNR
jgi:hypothetical protein